MLQYKFRVWVQDIPRMPSIECSLFRASWMLPEDASHPVYCTAFDGLFVLSMSCKPGYRSNLERMPQVCISAVRM